MTIIDISRTLWPDVATWPGDTRFGLTTVLDRAKGHSVNLTTITMSAHTGSHVDAPRHYTDAGATIEGVDLRPFWGLAQVVTINKPPGPLFPQGEEGSAPVGVNGKDGTGNLLKTWWLTPGAGL